MYRRLLPALLALPLFAACGTGTDGAGGTSGSAAGQVRVAAAFYPLVYASEEVGGDHVAVAPLTKPGSEPHDLELTPKEVADLSSADLVVYESGFQPAVDAAVATLPAGVAVDVAPTARLDLAAAPDGAEHPTSDQAHAGGSTDPHFWLDPTRLADVATAIAGELARVDPGHADAYRANASALRGRLSALDADFEAGLADCRSRDVVTSHAAFGYLAQRYDLTERSVSGLSPDGEPSASQMAATVDFVRAHGVRTVFAETLVSQRVAEAVAAETGAEVAVLDPVEGITDASAGRTYPEVMRANLAALETGLGCR